nr:hypothetical protein [Oscillospiraceae bacterium]
MARRSRNRYREMESLMTKIILADVLVFILYLLCAGLGWTVLKVITASIAIIGSVLCAGWLYITGEFTRRRSLWMVTGFICIVICVVVSLLLNYPCPAVVAELPAIAG